MIEAGIYKDLTSEEYHADKTSISRSAIMDFKKNPRLYWAKHLNPARPIEEQKPSWTFGTAFHTLILEPHLFADNYFIMPEKVLLKDVGREAYDAFKAIEKEAESTDKTLLSFADCEKLRAMRDSLFANARAKELVEGAIYESSYVWEDADSGMKVKSRPDILHQRMYVDLKTIDDASPNNYQREMSIYGYHIQAAMLKDGLLKLENRDLLAYINLCVEKKYPHCIGIYMIGEESIQKGQIEYKKVLGDMKKCQDEQYWPDYDIQTIDLPYWSK